jgi:acetoacetyl-CoA synthetase
MGAVFSSCAPEFGEQAIINRLEQIKPRVLFVCDGYSYGGKHFQILEKVRAVTAQIESIQSVVVVPFLEDQPDITTDGAMLLFNDFLISGSVPEYAQLPFDHPLFILYSSGTTGKPKCIVHGAGGTLLQHLKELVLHTNLSSADTIFYYTNCGWMMWNWLVSALATQANVVLYDGSPVYPEPDSLWRMVAEEGVTVFGTSPGFLLAGEKAGVKPKLPGLNTRLHTILSTGAPLAPESFDYVRNNVGRDIHLSSIAGGTDLISCFALGNPLLPVYRGELQCFGLGMAVNVFDSAGQPVLQQTGELVCTQPFPSMPIGFWNDPDGQYYSQAYFEHFPGVWAHGDLAEITEHAGLVISGRADAVLNPGGVRIGSAEVCGPVLMLKDVVDCIAVGQHWQGDVRIVLFVVLAKSVLLDQSLKDRIAAQIRNAASPRHVPAVILEVADIPRTLSGKPLELVVRAIIHGEPVQNIDTIANPDALAYFQDRPELAEPAGNPESG